MLNGVIQIQFIVKVRPQLARNALFSARLSDTVLQRATKPLSEYMKRPKPNSESDLIAFRSAVLKEKLQDLVAANPGKITMTAVIIAAVEEKLKRLAAGEGQALNLSIPPSFGVSPEATAG